MDDIVRHMLSMKNWAVAGKTHDDNKYAYKVYMKLKKHGFNVFSINPTLNSVDGDNSYKSLKDIPVVPDVISMVINPIQGRQIVEGAIEIGVKNIWFQPGAETEELINMAVKSKINVIYDKCVLVEMEY